MPGEDSHTCRDCGSEVKVIDSRPTANGRLRRKECIQCGERFSTREIRADALEDLKNLRKSMLDLVPELLNTLGYHLDTEIE